MSTYNVLTIGGNKTSAEKLMEALATKGEGMSEVSHIGHWTGETDLKSFLTDLPSSSPPDILIFTSRSQDPDQKKVTEVLGPSIPKITIPSTSQTPDAGADYLMQNWIPDASKARNHVNLLRQL